MFDSPGTVSPLKVIWTTCVPDSCGVKLAMNFCPPNARTDDVTLPPFTKISKLPEPARDPSTKVNVGKDGVSCQFKIG